MIWLLKAWAAVKVAAAWLKTYWYIPAVLIGSALWWAIVRRPDNNPIEKTKLELEVIKAEASAKKLEAELTTERAIVAVKEQYSANLEALNADQKEQAKTLEANPAALAKFLVRAGRPAGRR